MLIGRAGKGEVIIAAAMGLNHCIAKTKGPHYNGGLETPIPVYASSTRGSAKAKSGGGSHHIAADRRQIPITLAARSGFGCKPHRAGELLPV